MVILAEMCTVNMMIKRTIIVCNYVFKASAERNTCAYDYGPVPRIVERCNEP